MASSLEFVRYAAEQMGAAGEITYLQKDVWRIRNLL